MNVKKIFKILTEQWSILIPAAALFTLAVINSFMYIGLLEDGHHHFWKALITDNIFLGHEGISHFPYNSRYFPTLLSHLSVGISVSLGIISIKNLLFIFTFVSYISPVIFLTIIYLNIPKDKKFIFELILLSFLICLIYMVYQIWTENLSTGLFLWIIFIIYYYTDFNNMSKINTISLLLFSIMLISSHPMVVIFIPLLLFLGISKYIKTPKIKLFNKIIIILSFIALFCACLFNIYFIIHPIFPFKDYMSFTIFKNTDFIFFLISIFMILYLSFSKNEKTKCYNCTIAFFILCFLLFNILTFNVKTHIGFTYRILGFYSPLFFILLILVYAKLNLSLKIINIKILNMVLCIVILTNSLYYGKAWMKYINNLEQYIVKSEKTDITEIIQYHIYHPYSLPFILIFIPSLSNNNNLKNFLPANFFKESINEIVENKKTLKKFNIDIDNIVKYDK